ncbi:phage head-tail joining protein [Vibrio parahaemolyticus]|uniref:phage head-tail joining protein n=1 Tax=Vibrio parahaemolyticus TaxID=670 RepID=UPI00387AB504
MAFSKDDIDVLDEAIVTGELTVKINGREVTYRSIKELREARRMVLRMIARQSGVRISAFSGVTTNIDRGIR